MTKWEKVFVAMLLVLFGMFLYFGVALEKPQLFILAAIAFVIVMVFGVVYPVYVAIGGRRFDAQRRREAEMQAKFLAYRQKMEAYITDPTPCPLCGYGTVSAKHGGYCFDCRQYVFPVDMPEQTPVEEVTYLITTGECSNLTCPGTGGCPCGMYAPESQSSAKV